MNAATDTRWAVLDLETRCHVPLARQVLGLGDDVPVADVQRRLVERRRGEGGGEFLKLPFHVPVASAVLLAEHRDDRVVATRWSCWKEGDAPLEDFVARFFDDLAGRVYVGFNSSGFDLPLMELWASRCRVGAPEHFGRTDGARGKRSERHCDLQKELVAGSWGSGSFDDLCKFHGLPGKPGIRGEEVEGLVAQGRLPEVHAYNVTDVVQNHLLLLHVLVRAGTLTREGAGKSARAALALTREQVLAALPPGPAHTLLERSLDACERAPIAG